MDEAGESVVGCRLLGHDQRHLPPRATQDLGGPEGRGKETTQAGINNKYSGTSLKGHP